MERHSLNLMEVLGQIYFYPKKLQSNFCREHSWAIARLASLGLITTKLPQHYGHSWRMTAKGLIVIEMGDLDESAW